MEIKLNIPIFSLFKIFFSYFSCGKIEKHKNFWLLKIILNKNIVDIQIFRIRKKDNYYVFLTKYYYYYVTIF